MLLLLAGALAAVVQYLMPASSQGPSKVPTSVPVRTAETAPPQPTIRKILPPPQSQGGAAPVVVPAPTPAPQVQPAPTIAAPAEPAPPVLGQDDTTSFPTPPPSAAPQGEAEVAKAETTEGPPALAILDLNTASVAELNHLRGGGNIGRAIVAKRPYGQVGDLLTKRVLSRSVYDRIKEQVTVR